MSKKNVIRRMYISKIFFGGGSDYILINHLILISVTWIGYQNWPGRFFLMRRYCFYISACLLCNIIMRFRIQFPRRSRHYVGCWVYKYEQYALNYICRLRLQFRGELRITVAHRDKCSVWHSGSISTCW